MLYWCSIVKVAYIIDVIQLIHALFEIPVWLLRNCSERKEKKMGFQTMVRFLLFSARENCQNCKNLGLVSLAISVSSCQFGE